MPSHQVTHQIVHTSPKKKTNIIKTTDCKEQGRRNQVEGTSERERRKSLNF